MAMRTRKQYLTDLAENHITAITLDQANTSGRVGTIKVSAGKKNPLVNIIIHFIAGILRNLGHKKKERVRQESTLLYTPGALTWKVSIILRNGKVSVCLICVHAYAARFNGYTWIGNINQTSNLQSGSHVQCKSASFVGCRSTIPPLSASRSPIMSNGTCLLP